MFNIDNKKLFKMLGGVIGILLVIIIFFFIIIVIAGSKVRNDKLPLVIEQAAIKYYADHKDELPKVEGDSVTLDASTLISSKYMKSFEKMSRNTGCSAKIVTTNNNGEYNHIVSVDCNEFKTQSIYDVVSNTVTKTGDGLYLENCEYYYKGEYVDNYVKIGEELFRIVSIDKDGNIKLTNTTFTKKLYAWDDRYNVEMRSAIGINNYSLSRIKEHIDSEYDKFDNNLKKHIIMHDWCIGQRSIEDGSLQTNECSDTIKDYVGLITLNEYVRPSMDSNCNSIFTGACANYNYLVDLYDDDAWSAISTSDNTYQAFYVSGSYIEEENTNRSYKVLLMFYIDGSTIYTSGTGTESDPYVIK